MPLSVNEQPVIIVGAGTAGLCAAHALRQAGIDFQLLERAPHLAASWRQRHPRLVMNTHSSLSALPGAQFPSGTRGFATRDQLVTHIEDFAREAGLPVEHGVDVRRIAHRDGRYIIETDTGERVARHVVIASGRDRRPVMPEWVGKENFTGSLIHASAFSDAADYEGKSILVIGAGNSGFDVLNHLSRVRTGPVWLAVRRSPTVLPRRLMGVTVHRLSPVLSRLPVPLVDTMLSISQRLAYGDLRRLGFPPETEGGASRLRNEQVAIVVDEGAMHAIRKRRISLVPSVRAFCGGSVILADDSRISPDVVIAATGYSPALDEVMPDISVFDNRGFPAINGAEQAPAFPGLWFIGMRASLLGDIGSARRQATAIAKAIAASH